MGHEIQTVENQYGKEQLRKILHDKRKEMSPEDVKYKSRMIEDRLLSMDELREAKTVMIYVDFDKEVGTRDIINKLLTMGKTVVVPYMIIKDHSLGLFELKDLNELEPNKCGIPEPKKEMKKDSNRDFSGKNLDIIIVPGIGFDKEGNRIGFGGGYYDRFLGKSQHSLSGYEIFLDNYYKLLNLNPFFSYYSKLLTELLNKFDNPFLSSINPKPLTIALAFEQQMVPAVPAGIHDKPLDRIVTEYKIIKCGNHPNPLRYFN